MPIDYTKYPANWKTEIRPAILKRARNRCEFCGVPNGMAGTRNDAGDFLPATDTEAMDGIACDGKKVFRIVLTIAHINHDITDNRPENLRALCQRCHLTHDKKHHAQTRWRNRYGQTPDLF